MVDSLRTELNSSAFIGSKLVSVEIDDSKMDVAGVEDMNMHFWEQYQLFRNDRVSRCVQF